MKKLDPKKYPCKTISKKLCPRDYFEEENKHLNEIGAKSGTGVNIQTPIPGVYEGRLYFDDNETLKSAMQDLKMINVIPVIKCGLTRIVLYTEESSSLLYFYIKGRGIDAQGIFRHLSKH